jgi:hypothetical protein
MARKDRFLAGNSWQTGQQRARYALSMTTHMAQNELDFRLARSQFLYEQADRKARQAVRQEYWSKLGKAAWWTLVAATLVLFVVSVGPGATLALSALVLLSPILPFIFVIGILFLTANPRNGGPLR